MAARPRVVVLPLMGAENDLHKRTHKSLLADLDSKLARLGASATMGHDHTPYDAHSPHHESPTRLHGIRTAAELEAARCAHSNRLAALEARQRNRQLSVENLNRIYYDGTEYTDDLGLVFDGADDLTSLSRMSPLQRKIVSTSAKIQELLDRSTSLSASRLAPLQSSQIFGDVTRDDSILSGLGAAGAPAAAGAAGAAAAAAAAAAERPPEVPARRTVGAEAATDALLQQQYEQMAARLKITPQQQPQQQPMPQPQQPQQPQQQPQQLQPQPQPQQPPQQQQQPPPQPQQAIAAQALAAPEPEPFNAWSALSAPLPAAPVPAPALDSTVNTDDLDTTNARVAHVLATALAGTPAPRYTAAVSAAAPPPTAAAAAPPVQDSALDESVARLRAAEARIEQLLAARRAERAALGLETTAASELSVMLGNASALDRSGRARHSPTKTTVRVSHSQWSELDPVTPAEALPAPQYYRTSRGAYRLPSGADPAQAAHDAAMQSPARVCIRQEDLDYNSGAGRGAGSAAAAAAAMVGGGGRVAGPADALNMSGAAAGDSSFVFPAPASLLRVNASSRHILRNVFSPHYKPEASLKGFDLARADLPPLLPGLDDPSLLLLDDGDGVPQSPSMHRGSASIDAGGNGGDGGGGEVSTTMLAGELGEDDWNGLIPACPSPALTERLLHTLEYVSHKRYTVRLQAMRNLYTLAVEAALAHGGDDAAESGPMVGAAAAAVLQDGSLEFGAFALERLVAGVVANMERLDRARPTINAYAVGLLSLLGMPWIATALPILEALLRDDAHAASHRAILHLLIATGARGLDVAVSVLAELGLDAGNRAQLDALANHPRIQELVIVPELTRLLTDSPAAPIRSVAALALSKLFHAARSALPALEAALVTGSVDRGLAARALRVLGAAGERSLIRLLATAGNGRVREAAVYGLGLPVYEPALPVFGTAAASALEICVEADLAAAFAGPTRDVQYVYLVPAAAGAAAAAAQDQDDALFDEWGPPAGLSTAFNGVPGAGGAPASAIRGPQQQQQQQQQQQEQESTPSVQVSTGPVVHERLIFDARELVASVRRGIARGLFDVVGPADRVPAVPVAAELHSTTNTTAAGPAAAFVYHPYTRDAVTALMHGLCDADDGVRLAAVAAAAEMGLAAAAPLLEVLERCLTDAAAPVREAAARAIGRLRPPQVRPETVRRLTALVRDGMWAVRYAAVRALGLLGPLAIDALAAVEGVLRDGSVTRNLAAAAMARMGERGEDRLRALLRYDTTPNSQIRVAVVYGLRSASVFAANIDYVCKDLFALGRDPSPLVRRATMETLGVLGQRAQELVPYVNAQSLLSYLYAFLGDADKAVRCKAAEMVAEYGPQGELLLIEGVLKDRNAAVREAAAYGLAIVGAHTVRTLLLVLGDASPAVRRTAGKGLAVIGREAILAELAARPQTQRDSVCANIRELVDGPAGARLPRGTAGFLNAIASALQ